MSNALMMAIIGTLRPVPAVATGITNVGSLVTEQTLAFSTGQLSGAATFALPAGCQAGDTVTITCIGTSYSSGFAWQTPLNAIVVVSQRTFAAGYSTAVYARMLVQTDIDAGNIQVPIALTTSGSWSIPVIGIVDADRGVSPSYIDVIGAFGTGSLAIGPNACLVPGVTTTTDGDLLRYVIFATPTSAGATITPPGGYTAGDPPSSANSGSIYTGFALQSVAGATGDQSVGVSPPQTGTWTGLLIALRPKAPAIILTYALPATATAGVAYSGSITATLVDGATGPVTITATPLPDGVAAGTVVDNGDGSYTLPISGTPTTAQTVSVGIGATNGTQTASATQSVVVSAATAKSVVQSAVISFLSPNAIGTFSAPPTAGNMLVVELRATSTAFPSLPVTDTAGNVWTALADTGTAPGSTSSTRMVVLGRISNGTETNVSIPFGSSNMTGVMMEISGVTSVNGTPAMAVGAAARSGMTFLCPSATPTVGGTLALAFGGSTSSSSGITYTAASGWTMLPWSTAAASYTSGCAYKLQDGSMAAVSTTLLTNVALSSNSCTITLLLQ